MKRFTVLFFCFLTFLGAAQPLKVVQVIPFGNDNLKIIFNHSISANDIRKKTITASEELLDIPATLMVKSKTFHFSGKRQIGITQSSKKNLKIILKAQNPLHYKLSFEGKNLYIKFAPLPSTKSKNTSTPKTPQENKKTRKQTPPTTPPKPKKNIMIDAGHGGKDCGAVGTLKICEKIITLKIALLLEDELKKRGYTVFMTRAKDIYIDLRKRTQLANIKNADLFISIHANSVSKKSAHHANGIETYFLSTARSERAMRIAEAENKGDIEVMNYFSKQSFLNALNTHRLIASNKLAIDIQRGMLKTLKPQFPNITDGGVREGPFWVLAGALMPSVLIEVGYLSHPKEGQRINQRTYQSALVKGIADGIDDYFAKN